MSNVTTGATAIQIAPVSGLEYVELQKHRALDGVDLEKRRQVFSYALAVVLARVLPLPTAPVESPAAYYISNIEQQVREIASAFNEKVIVDYEIVRDFTQKLWSIRYFSVHNTANIASFYPYNFFEIIAGIGNHIDEKTYAFVNEQKVAIIDLSNAISRIISKVEEATEEVVSESAVNSEPVAIEVNTTA